VASRKRPLPKKLVAVEWRDTYYTDDVKTEEDLAVEDTTCTIYTAGFYAGEDSQVYKVALDWSPHGNHFRHVTRIRRENIQHIHEIASAKEPH